MENYAKLNLNWKNYFILSEDKNLSMWLHLGFKPLGTSN